MHVIYQLKGETMTIYFCGDQKFVCIVSLSVISMYFQVVVFVMCVCMVDYFLFDCVFYIIYIFYYLYFIVYIFYFIILYKTL